MNINEAKANNFLKELFIDSKSGWLTLWAKPSKKTYWYEIEQVNQAQQRAAKLSQQEDVYFALGLRGKKLDQGRGGNDNVISLPCLWVDLDIASSAHKQKDLPPDMEAGLKFLSEFPLQPTALVNSGYGVHAYWYFIEPWQFNTEEERQQAADLSQSFQHTLITMAKKKGWTIDNTSDLARILRIPGTWNHKNKDDIRPVEVIEITDNRYNPADFEQYLFKPQATQTAPGATIPFATIEHMKKQVSLYKYIDNAGHKLTKVGTNKYRVNPCPVCGHKDHFTVYTDDNSFYSFSCINKGGSIIDYMIEVEGMNKKEAIKTLEQLAGAPLITEEKQREDQGPAAADKEERQKETPSSLAERALNNIMSTDYYNTRGLTDKTINKYRLGYLPEGHYYGEAFKYILPVSDTCCILRSEDREGEAKYKVAGKRELFNVRYLEDPSLQEVFITEGIIDALSLEEQDRPAIALNSTDNKGKLLEALETNREQLKDKTFIIALDTDTEGTHTAEKLLEGAQGLGLQAVIFNLEGFKDINEALTAKDLPRQLQQFEEGLQGQLEAEKLKGTVHAYLLEQFEVDQAKRLTEPDIKTGLQTLDHKLGGGLYPGLCILGASPSIGKTALALQIADKIAEQGQQVLFFSLEMGMYEMTCRSLTREYFKKTKNDKISTGHVIKPGHNNTDIYSNIEFKAALEGYLKGPAKNLSLIEGGFGLDIEGIRSEVKKNIARTKSRPVVFIDYLQVIAPPKDSRLSDKQHTDLAVVALKRLSRDLDLPVIAISSFNRQSQSKDKGKKEPSMLAFKESGSIEYTADILLHMDIREVNGTTDNQIKIMEPRPIELFIIKNRRGKAFDSIPLDYHTKQNFFTEI